jgi:two-component system, NarL family, competent response regulator ComA
LINLLIVDDHPAIGEGTKLILEQEEDFKVDFIDPGLISTIDFKNYQVFILDLYMPEINGLVLAKNILATHPEAIILINTGFEISTHFTLMIEAGVHGFISKTATKEQLITSIRCALRDEVVIPLQLLKQLKKVESKPVGDELADISLNSREQQILVEVAKGGTNREIAENLILSQRTVEYCLTGIFTKFGVKSRTEALNKATKLGLIPSQLIEIE